MTLTSLVTLWPPFGGTSVVHADFWAALCAYVAEELPELNGLWEGRAPDEVDGLELEMPFAVYEDGAGVGPEYLTGSPAIQTGSASISIYTTSRESALTLSRALADVVRDAPLRFEDGRLMYLRAGLTYAPRLEDQPGPGGVDVWRAMLMLDYVYSTAG